MHSLMFVTINHLTVMYENAHTNTHTHTEEKQEKVIYRDMQLKDSSTSLFAICYNSEGQGL